MRGNWMGARLTSSMLKALGRPEWIAENRGEYGQILQTLVAGRSALAAIKQTLRSEVLASELCDQRGLERDLGAAFGGMVESLKQQRLEQSTQLRIMPRARLMMPTCQLKLPDPLAQLEKLLQVGSTAHWPAQGHSSEAHEGYPRPRSHGNSRAGW
jgi:hypothetical protein